MNKQTDKMTLDQMVVFLGAAARSYEANCIFPWDSAIIDMFGDSLALLREILANGLTADSRKAANKLLARCPEQK